MLRIVFHSLLVFTLCLSSVFQVKAQSIVPIQYGLVTGLNLSDLYTADAVSNLNAGFNLGGFIRLPLTKTIDIEPELYLSTKGSSVVYNSLLVVNTANLNLTYLEMPVLAVFRLTDLLHFMTGPYVSYLITAQVRNVSSINVFNFAQSLNMDNYNRVDAGVVVAVGLDVKSITMGLRYNLSLISVGKNQQLLGSTYNLTDARNGVLNFYLAIGFNQHCR